MIRRVVIIGAGMGGLTAALRLAQQGLSVRIIEARPEAGGLASAFQTDGFVFDAGPYILLDRPGLEWAFRSLGLELSEHVTLRRIDDVYQVLSSQSPTVNFYADVKTTAAGLEAQWPGSGKRYEHFVAEMKNTHERLSPLLHVSRPGPANLFHNRAFTRIPFLLRSLGSILARTNLPQPVIDAIAIWTQIAGQRIDEAPSPMAFVPALIHSVGAFYPVEGIGSIPRTLAQVATKAGVEFQFGARVRSIVSEHGRVCGVQTNQDEFVPADAIVSNYNGIGTYLEMLSDTPAPGREKLKKLALQSPGACAYLAVRGEIKPPYLRFQLPGNGELCRLFVTPTVVAPELERNGWFPARLISPMRHEIAEGLSIAEQRDYLERLLAESWWREGLDEVRVVATRVPAEWGAQYNLYRNSMNPVMTAGFMRAGRLAHKSAYARGLYLAGSSTHPGQWVSFCAISGILAANDLLEDMNE
jgi:phytoene dehydrogenase-like protein